MDAVLKPFFGDEFEQIPNDIHSKSKALRKGIIFHCALLDGFIEGMWKGKSGYLTTGSTGPRGTATTFVQCFQAARRFPER
jgi:hypothetical protein